MKVINKEIYRNRQNRMAKTPLLMKEVMTEISRCLEKNMIRFNNSATWYYDRIVAAIGSLISQAYEMNKAIAVAWGKTLKEAE